MYFIPTNILCRRKCGGKYWGAKEEGMITFVCRICGDRIYKHVKLEPVADELKKNNTSSSLEVRERRRAEHKKYRDSALYSQTRVNINARYYDNKGKEWHREKWEEERDMNEIAKALANIKLSSDS